MSECGGNVRPERRRLVLLSASAASFSASSSVIGRHHPYVAATGMAIVLALLVYVAVCTVRLRRRGNEQ